MQKAAKLNLLDHFYHHLDENDWLEGVDLYQAGRVIGITLYEGLITCRVGQELRGDAEVRIKFHPAGHCIQWIECTCRKNRTYGQYCEHIASVMIHVDRERPELFSKLDTAMPIKPPAPPKRAKPAKEPTAPKPAADSKGQGAAQKILEHLKGKIQSVSLLAQGPMLRVRIEIKPGHMTHYDLDLDQSAKFLDDHPKLSTASPEVLKLSVHTTPAELGTRIYQPDDAEKIVAERVAALRLGPKLKVQGADHEKLLATAGHYKRVSLNDPEGHEGQYLFIAIKTASKYIGREFFFLPGLGYFPLNHENTNSSWNDLPISKTFKEDEAANFAKDNFHDYLLAAPIFLDEHLKDPIILEAPELSEIQLIDQGSGWFKLDPRYGHGKVSVSMIDLMKHYRKKRRKYMRSGNMWLKIPEFVTQHQWELDESGEALKVDALGLLRIKAAVGDFDRFVGSKKLINQMRTNLEFAPETAPPITASSRIKLRSYQEVGLRWFWWLYKNGLHGLLADEMGLGKTHQAMALLSAIKTENPKAKFLVICPTTVLDHWIDKIEEYAPELQVVKFHGQKRGNLVRLIEQDKSTLITSYGVLLRDIRYLTETTWDAVILDEAHLVKNNDTATYRAACRLSSRIRICLTGTPMENHLGELKSIFDFLVPGYLGSDEYFRKTFRSPIESNEEPETELALQKLIHPFKLRRIKDNVLSELPPKVEDFRHCSLTDEQVKIYREIVALKASPLVDQLKNDASPIPYLHVFATLTMLKQVCNHPALLRDPANFREHESGKFELLKELLDEALGSGHKIVIYSQYVAMIKIIESYLRDINVGHVTLTGQTRNRGEVIKRFQTDPSLKIFCGSLLAGGIGIDLTAASVVIHYDRWWNASKENQATDRVHRIGQNRNVQVLKLITRGTLEEKIDRMIRNKQAIFQKFLDKDEEVFKTLSRQELIELLS